MTLVEFIEFLTDRIGQIDLARRAERGTVSQIDANDLGVEMADGSRFFLAIEAADE